MPLQVKIINIGYFSTPDASVKVSSGEGISGPATWTTTSIEYDANANLWGTSLAFDNNAYSHMVFFNASTSVEVYANNTSGSWARLVIGHSTATNFQSSVAIDHNNYVHIATYGMNEVSSSGLQYFTNTSGSFVPVLVDTGNVGKQNAIAIDSNNHAHISYYDQTNHDLKYATNKNGVWQTMIVDSTGDVGYANSIAINASNEVYISYFDGTNDKLKLAIGH